MKLARVLLAGAALTVLLQCSADKPATQLQPGTASIGGTQGLMNFRQIRAAWASVTGLDPYSLPLEASFDELKDRLPANNAPDQLTQPVVTASIALGSAYCFELVDREAKIDASERRYFGQINLKKAPEDSGLKDAALKLTTALWRRAMNEEEGAELVTLAKDIYQIGVTKPGATPNSANREAWQALCTAAGASLDALTL